MSKPKAGMGVCPERKITAADIKDFGTLTGDNSAMHTAPEFADANGNNIAHGLLGASLAVGDIAATAPQRFGECKAFFERFSVNFRAPVRANDTLVTQWQLVEESTNCLVTQFRQHNQHEVLVNDGEIISTAAEPSSTEKPSLWPDEAVLKHKQQEKSGVWYLEDYAEHELIGETVGQRLTAAGSSAYGQLTRNKLAASDEHQIQAMLCFDIAFAAWLSEWTARPMPDAGFAGHLSDQWQAFAPVFVGDTLRTRYQTLNVRRSKSRSDMGIITFGLQVINQHDVFVQQAQVLMMYPGRNA